MIPTKKMKNKKLNKILDKIYFEIISDTSLNIKKLEISWKKFSRKMNDNKQIDENILM